MEATDIEHSLVVEGEFDALSVEIRVPASLHGGVTKKYPAKLHARKVAKALGAQQGVVYLPGQWDVNWEDSDQGPPFRQRRYFYYLTGVNFPGCSVTYDIEADKLTLWIPYTPPATVLWFGNTPSPEDCLARSDVHDVKYTNLLSEYLASRLAKVKTLYVLRASQMPKFAGFDSLKPRLYIDTTSLQPIMDEARVTKCEYEIDMIRKANAVSSTAHKEIARLMYGLSNECQIEGAFLNSCTAQNAHMQAYPIIAGSGANASTLHYDANNEPLAGRQLVVLDAGAEWECYASDVTRTLPIGSVFSPEAKAIYDLVHQMQEECIQRIRPGVMFRDLQLHATLVAVKGLLRLGILHNGTADEIFKNGTGSAFFPHGLGHHVGLDVHDVLSKELLHPAGESMWGKRRPIGPGSLRAMIKQSATRGASSDGNASVSDATVLGGRQHSMLQANMIVTVEPGVYFCRSYIEAYFLRSDQHKNYINQAVLERYWVVGGVRIEDCSELPLESFPPLSSNLTTPEMSREYVLGARLESTTAA
ncbi:metallopeptidase family M24-domain-containing protein [Nemania abortiva]|nr:metallopeptidase family M24-domain-containing protein [Nemania abortiva]